MHIGSFFGAKLRYETIRPSLTHICLSFTDPLQICVCPEGDFGLVVDLHDGLLDNVTAVRHHVATTVWRRRRRLGRGRQVRRLALDALVVEGFVGLATAVELVALDVQLVHALRQVIAAAGSITRRGLTTKLGRRFNEAIPARGRRRGR